MTETETQENIDELRSLKSSNARRTAMPSLQATLAVWFEAYQRLKELGFSDGIYCPKDGSVFEVVQLGSTGVFRCSWSGDPMDGHAMLQDGRDIYPQRPGGLMWRKIKK